jgi:hypothetical protein
MLRASQHTAAHWISLDHTHTVHAADRSTPPVLARRTPGCRMV